MRMVSLAAAGRQGLVSVLVGVLATRRAGEARLREHPFQLGGVREGDGFHGHMSAGEGNAVSMALDAMVSVSAARVGTQRVNHLFMRSLLSDEVALCTRAVTEGNPSG